MKLILILLLSFSFTDTTFGLADSNLTDSIVHSGFANKADAKNKMVNGVKEGKWIEYFGISNGVAVGTDKKHATAYTLTIYKAGAACGSRQFYMSGKLMTETVHTYGKNDYVERFYYESGKVLLEIPYPKDQTNRTETMYYESGKIKRVTIYSPKSQEAITKNYDENGNEIK